MNANPLIPFIRPWSWEAETHPIFSERTEMSTLMEEEKVVERLREYADHYDPVDDDAAEHLRALLTQAADLIARQTAERDEATAQSLANNILSHGWMVAHDCLKSGLPYKYPAPADVPETLARALTAEAALQASQREKEALREALEAHMAAIAWVGQVYPSTSRDGSKGAIVHMTWGEFNAMRSLIGRPKLRPASDRRARTALKASSNG